MATDVFGECQKASVYIYTSKWGLGKQIVLPFLVSTLTVLVKTIDALRYFETG